MATHKRIIPAATFELIPFLFTRFAETLKQCKVTVYELLILMHFRAMGHLRDERYVIRRKDAADFLKTVMVKNNTPSGIAKFLGRMVDQKLIETTSLTAQELNDWYAQDGGFKHGLVLTRNGEARLQKFEEEINQRLVSRFPPTLRLALAPALRKITKHLRDQYHSDLES